MTAPVTVRRQLTAISEPALLAVPARGMVMTYIALSRQIYPNLAGDLSMASRSIRSHIDGNDTSLVRIWMTEIAVDYRIQGILRRPEGRRKARVKRTKETAPRRFVSAGKLRR